MTCPNCQKEVKSGAAYCGNCGYQLIAAQPVQQAVTGQPVPTIAPTPSLQTVPGAQQSVSQPAFAGAAGNGYAMTSANSAGVPADNHNNGKAIAAFVCGILGCIAWLIPLIGVILGVLALIFGTIAAKSPRRVYAIIGIVLAVPVLALSIYFWVRAAQQVIKNRSNPVSGLTTPATSGSTQTVTTPCYVAKIPAPLKLTQTTGSCTFQALDQAGGEEYEVKVLQLSQLTADNLSQVAQQDSSNVINATPGGSISSQQGGTFAGKQAYTINLAATDGSAGTIDYVYNSTTQGNLVIVLHVKQDGKNSDLSSIEQSWSWQ